jgi:hypothetical protein
MIDEDDDCINCTNWILIIILVIQINNIVFTICVILIILLPNEAKKEEEKSNKIINVIYISNLIFEINIQYPV